MKTLEEHLEDYWNAAFEEGVTGAETDEGAAQAALHGIQTKFHTIKARVAKLEKENTDLKSEVQAYAESEAGSSL